MGNMTTRRQGLGRPHVICVMVLAAILSGVGGAAAASAAPTPSAFRAIIT